MNWNQSWRHVVVDGSVQVKLNISFRTMIIFDFQNIDWNALGSLRFVDAVGSRERWGMKVGVINGWHVGVLPLLFIAPHTSRPFCDSSTFTAATKSSVNESRILRCKGQIRLHYFAEWQGMVMTGQQGPSKTLIFKTKLTK